MSSNLYSGTLKIVKNIFKYYLLGNVFNIVILLADTFYNNFKMQPVSLLLRV